MGKYLNVGNAGFATIRKGTYVDKTGMISFLNSTLGTKEKLTCVSRPRRFGKSFAAQMLCAYYDKSCDSRKLFEGLQVSQDASFEEHLNKYDVIYLDITEFTSDAFVKREMQNLVQNLELKIIQELAAAYPEVERQNDLPNMLYMISESTGHRFIFIIDEWDALFRENKQDSLQQESYIRLLRGLFKNSGKTDKMIEAAYMTGILPIKKYGTQSAMTDFQEYTMTQPEPLEAFVGFTEQEVQALCENANFDFEDVRKWYDGYILGSGTHIYSPKSVIEAVQRKRIGNYWTQSETYESLRLYIELNEDGLKEAIVQMLGGARIKIDVATFQNDLTTIKSRDDVLTLLVHLGYLAYEIDRKSVYIPNEEVREEYVRAITTGKHTEIARLIRNSDHLLEATLNLDEETVAAAIEEAHQASTAPTFYNNEQALRSVIRFAYLSCVDEFLKIEELPSGHGYADVVFFPKKSSSMPLLLIELKWNKTEAGALGQIRQNHYPQALKDYGGKILLVGINYDAKNKKHTCKIEEYDKKNC
ncbi:MAG: AAA family ATPase [Eubacteriales bacterium]|nr:AAA family ATPase [Eubacteriales bacterium]